MRTWLRERGPFTFLVRMEDGKEEMPSCPRRRPLRALPYFSPSCQGTTGLLANLDFSIDGPLSSRLWCSCS